MANKSGFEEDFIREVCFSKPLKNKVEEFEKEGYKITKGTDNFLAMVDDLASVSKIIKTVTKIRIPHKDYNFVPFELAVGVDEIKYKK